MAKAKRLLLVFSASWCGPCRNYKPIVQRSGYPHEFVDIDKDKRRAREYKIRSIPTSVLILDGREARREVGAMSAADLRRFMQSTKSLGGASRDDNYPGKAERVSTTE